MKRLLLLLLVLIACQPATHADVRLNTLRRSLVRVSVTAQEPNYRVPWNPGSVGSGVGAGFVISGQRIMTNAHVVSNGRFLTIERENDAKKYLARVIHVAHDCDLAVLQLEDPSFFKNTAALDLGGLPEIESTVSVYGYPIGGDRLSVTRGVVSRIDFQLYSHSGADSHLAIQIDAAINPGNSGGPVMQDGKVVGVAFQGYSGAVAQNVGYMIPTPVIRRFLKDIEDGTYDRYVDLSVQTFPLQNPAMRKALGLEDNDHGILISEVMSAGCAHGILQKGDVLMKIDGMTVASDGFVELDGSRIEMPEIVERKFKGEIVKLSVIRASKPLELEVKLDGIWPYLMQANSYDTKPRFILFAGLLFQPLSREFIDAWDPDDLRLRFFFDSFISDSIYEKFPEVVVLSALLPDPVNTYLGDFRNGILEEVNGEKIKSLKDAAAAFAKPAERYVLKFLGNGRPLVLESSTLETARERILQRYNVKEEERL